MHEALFLYDSETAFSISGVFHGTHFESQKIEKSYYSDFMHEVCLYSYKNQRKML